MGEHEEQATLIEWSKIMAYTYPLLERLYAVPNGGFRHPKVAAELQQEGLKPGVPDLMLPVPCGHYHGMYIEMKSHGGKVRPEQREWLEYLATAGYYACVCWSFEDAQKAIIEYLEKTPSQAPQGWLHTYRNLERTSLPVISKT